MKLFTMSLSMLAVATLVGCASSTIEQSYYRLPSLNSGHQLLRCENGAPRVTLSRFINRDGIVMQTSTTQFQAARQHRWLAPLREQLTLSLQAHPRLNGWACESHAEVYFSDFYGTDDGDAVIAGVWSWSQGGQLEQRAFHVREPLASDGYDGLVEALNRAWQGAMDTQATHINPRMAN